MGLGIFLCVLLVTFSGAKKTCRKPKILPLTTIHIIDRNGFAETISSKDRVTQFQNVDFLKPQPYQKVLRIYGRDSAGNVRSVVSTYYPNGNPKQFLEILNGRANGIYAEWHENGTSSLMGYTIGGMPDLTTIAEKSWLFDGTSCVWDDDENLLAQINYDQGSLEGIAVHYHPCGQIWKTVPYEKNLINGQVNVYKKCGALLMQTNYVYGLKNGKSIRYWNCDQIASEEEYCQNSLINGQYFDEDGTLTSEVREGYGFRAIFSKKGIRELQEITNGFIEGEVKVFDNTGAPKRVYHLKDGEKHGEEIEYYSQCSSEGKPQARISFNWYEGKVQGIAKTWYPNGHMESQKEMANNKKNGISTAWYRDGNLMLMEEYEEGRLIRGEYYKKGDRIPVSQITQGKGTATIYDADGNYVQKINYHNSKPEVK